VRLSELQNKDIIDMETGSKIGNIIDISFTKEGNLDLIIVEKNKFIISYFTSSNEIEIKWEQIKKIGEDVILVKI